MASPHSSRYLATRASFPISEISSYHSKWVICARVTDKSGLRSFASRGDTKSVFSATLLDESGSEIKASFFGMACDKYYGIIEQGKVYTFANGNVKVANRQYNRCNHRYELVFDRDAVIEASTDDAKIKTVSYDIVNLKVVQSRSLPCSVDLCGVIVSFRQPLAFTSKAGRELIKREITLADDTKTSMSVALWGERAKMEDKTFEGNPVVCLKGVSLNEFQGGRSGSLSESGGMDFKADVPEVKRLQQWWVAEGANADLTSLSLGSTGLTDLKAVQTKELPCTVDLCGILTSFKDIFSFTSKEGRELVKREITIADDTAMSFSVTLWGQKAQKENSAFEGNPVVGLKGVRVQEWNGGRSGSMLEVGSIVFQPATPHAEKVQQWWTQGGSTQSLTAISVEGPSGGGGGFRAATGTASNLAELREAAETVTTQGDTFTLVTRLALVQMKKKDEVQPLYYQACQEQRSNFSGTGKMTCNKRVDASGYCAACGRVVKTAPRLNIRCRFADYSDGLWLTTFHEPAQKVLQTSAEEAHALETGEGGRDAMEASIRKQYFTQPLQLSIRAKLDTYNGEARANITCIDARPVQRGVHARDMLKGIREMLAVVA